MQVSSIRTHDFQIGRFHAILDPSKEWAEARIRNELYLVGSLLLTLSRSEKVAVRLLSFETPIYRVAGKGRTRCIDLVGYDAAHRPYLIELKSEESREPLGVALEELSSYAEAFGLFREHYQREVAQLYHWSDFAFRGDARKMVLAPRPYYRRQKDLAAASRSGTLLCTFSRTETLEKDGKVCLLEKCGPKGYVPITRLAPRSS